VNTVFQLILVASALLQPEFGTLETQSCITYLSWLVAVTTVGSTFAYGAQHMRKRPGAVDGKKRMVASDTNQMLSQRSLSVTCKWPAPSCNNSNRNRNNLRIQGLAKHPISVT
ncbi:hypothetical protein Gohar_003108, partial [Gossypium harknessii]|nr:hypothetical protein [Gossypium harknessii]